MTDDKAAIDRAEYLVEQRLDGLWGAEDVQDLYDIFNLAREALRWRKACREPDTEERMEQLVGLSYEYRDHDTVAYALEVIRKEVNDG